MEPSRPAVDVFPAIGVLLKAVDESNVQKDEPGKYKLINRLQYANALS